MNNCLILSARKSLVLWLSCALLLTACASNQPRQDDTAAAPPATVALDSAPVNYPVDAAPSPGYAGENQDTFLMPRPQASAVPHVSAGIEIELPPVESVGQEPDSVPLTYMETAVEDDNYPMFPVTVPKASSWKRIPKQYLLNPDGATDIGYVINERLLPILEEGGYEYTFYKTKDRGLAIVTRAERFLPDGATDAPYRYSNVYYFNGLSDYFMELFHPKPQYYRIIVFMISPVSIVQSRETMTAEAGRQLFERGADRPLTSLLHMPFSSSYECTALIYECAKPNQEDDQVLVTPSILPCETHLKMAGIWQKLQNFR